MFENGNPQTLGALGALLQGGGVAGYKPEDRVNQFFNTFGAQNVDPVTRAKAMQLLMTRGINLPMGGGGTAGTTGNTGMMTPSGDFQGGDGGNFYGNLMQNYPTPQPQY
jgi:hypothetical protein